MKMNDDMFCNKKFVIFKIVNDDKCWYVMQLENCLITEVQKIHLRKLLMLKWSFFQKLLSKISKFQPDDTLLP